MPQSRTLVLPTKRCQPVDATADLHTDPLPRGAASGSTVARWTSPIAAQPCQRLDLHAAAGLDAGRFLHSAASQWTLLNCSSCAPWGLV